MLRVEPHLPMIFTRQRFQMLVIDQTTLFNIADKLSQVIVNTLRVNMQGALSSVSNI